MLITPEYLALNRERHERANSPYGTSGQQWAVPVNQLAQQTGARTLLDYGCGQGTLRTALLKFEPPPPYQVFEYDPAIPGKDEKPLRADMVVCGDVLEHIEPDCLYAVLDDIRAIARALVFLVIATTPAMKTLADGRNAHLIVEPAEWWLPKLTMRWEPRLFRALNHGFMFVGQRK